MEKVNSSSKMDRFMKAPITKGRGKAWESTLLEVAAGTKEGGRTDIKLAEEYFTRAMTKFKVNGLTDS